MNNILVVIAILFVSLIGYSLIRFFNLIPRSEKLLAYSYSFGIGAGLIYLQLFLFSLLNIPWKKEFILIPWLLLLSVIVFVKKSDIKTIKIYIPKVSKIQLFLFILIFLAAFYAFIEALIIPIATWDSWAIWLLKSKIFYIDGRVNSDILFYLKSDYPLLLNLLGTYFYIVLGKVNDSAILLVSFAFYLFLGLQIFSILRKQFGLTYALVFTFLFFSTQNFIRHAGRFESGQADLPLSYFAFSCVTLMLSYLKKDNFKILILLSIYLAFTAFVKIEATPFTFFILIPVLFHIYKVKKYNHLISVVIWLSAILSWQIYISKSGLRQENLGNLILVSGRQLFEIFKQILFELFNIKTWNFLWITYFFSIFAFIKNRSKEYIILNYIILSQLAFYIFPYITRAERFSPQSSIERLLLHLAPIALLLIAYLFAPIWENYFGSNRSSKNK